MTELLFESTEIPKVKPRELKTASQTFIEDKGFSVRTRWLRPLAEGEQFEKSYDYIEKRYCLLVVGALDKYFAYVRVFSAGGYDGEPKTYWAEPWSACRCRDESNLSSRFAEMGEEFDSITEAMEYINAHIFDSILCKERERNDG